MWQSIFETLRDEFADLNDPAQFTRVAVRLLVAIALGAIIGYERELHRKTAGLRTHMLVALGVALLVVAAEQSGIQPADMTRVLQGLFAGIGFLGAGAILKLDEKQRVTGLTTAASIWATAAIAAAAGLGRQATAVFATLLAYVILSLLVRLEQHFERDAPPRNGDEDASGSDSREQRLAARPGSRAPTARRGSPRSSGSPLRRPGCRRRPAYTPSRRGTC